MFLIVMKHIILMTIKGFIPDKVSTKSFLTEVADQLIKSDKVEASRHLSKLINMRYNVKQNIWEYIMKISILVSKLKALKLRDSSVFHSDLFSYTV